MGTFRTIVGGRSAGTSGSASFPRGIELLLKKARADYWFRSLFLKSPLAAAASLDLELGETEAKVLASMPRSALEDAVEYTRVAKNHLHLLRTGQTAAVIAVALTLMVAVPDVACGGEMEQPYVIQDWQNMVMERMRAIQEALESYKEAAGEYPSTLVWVTAANPLDGFIPRAYLYDPWYQRFHYEGVLRDGRVANYRLESVGADLEEAGDNVACPIDPDEHSFVMPNPITITSPQNGDTIPLAESGRTVTIGAAAAHSTDTVEVTWLLDRVPIQTTLTNHELSIVTGIGSHELTVQDGAGNSAVVVFEVTGAPSE